MAQTTGAPKRCPAPKQGLDKHSPLSLVQPLLLSFEGTCSTGFCLFNRERPDVITTTSWLLPLSGKALKAERRWKNTTESRISQRLGRLRFWQVGGRQACATLYFGKRTPLSMDLPPPAPPPAPVATVCGRPVQNRTLFFSFLVVILVQSPSPA